MATPQEVLDTATAKFEKGRRIHPEDGDNAVSATGELYIVITTGGPKVEGRSSGAFATNSATAINMWRQEIERYAAARPGILYWRQRPIIELQTYVPKDAPNVVGFELEVWQVYSRLLISAAPVIQPASKWAA